MLNPILLNAKSNIPSSSKSATSISQACEIDVNTGLFFVKLKVDNELVFLQICNSEVLAIGTTTSTFPSPSKSPSPTETFPFPPNKEVGEPKLTFPTPVPILVFNLTSIKLALPLSYIKSNKPSPLKSANAASRG